jgi:hypothetical protein
MARILENKYGKRNILLSTDDIISLIQEYQSRTKGIKGYKNIRKKLDNTKVYLPEEVL